MQLILRSVLDKKVYSKADRALVEETAVSPEITKSAMAILVWSAAAQAGLADQPKLEDLLFRLTVGSQSATEAMLHAQEFRDLVRLPVVRPDRTNLHSEVSALSQSQDASKITAEDRTFVEKAFRSEELADIGHGAIYLATKHDLNAVDLAWARAALDKRLVGATGPSLKFLTFVKRVVEIRSPP